MKKKLKICRKNAEHNSGKKNEDKRKQNKVET
jgi:hypothetical protein